MFGKTRDLMDLNPFDANAVDGILGDEDAASRAADMDDLRTRVEQVESQISSQFTSLATYAQIAQEQVELARSEARAQTERSEQRVTSLIERERADRSTALKGAPAGSAPDVMGRIDALERSVALLKQGLDDCRQQQKALAMAITSMFERFAPVQPKPAPGPMPMPAPLATEPLAPPSVDERPLNPSATPIPGLSLNG